MKIISPTLLLNKQKCLCNIEMMVSKANELGVKLRPHFKTHQSAEIGNWFKNYGIESCTVSSVKMAEYFYNNGWKDITLAFPLNALEIERINKIASDINFNAVIISPKTLSILRETLTAPVGIYIKIDTGTKRTGIPPENTELIDGLIEKISENKFLHFTGFLAHSGHTYLARSSKEVEEIHEQELKIMRAVKSRYIKAFPKLEISVGDTPSCSISSNFEGADEIRPGNYVFYDVMQCKIGSCNPEQIAIAMACPVVAKHPERNEIIVHGGAVHFSKDYILSDSGQPVYGYIVNLINNGWSLPVEGAYMRGLSQEHGVVKADDAVFNTISEGDIIGVLPVHSCLTADVMKEYFTLDGEKIEMMK